MADTEQKGLLSKLNPTAVVCACIFMVPGALIGQMLGLQFAATYTVLYSVLGSAIIGLSGYSVTSRLKHSNQNFFHYVAMAMSLVFGALWGSMSIGPVLFFYVTGTFGANFSIGLGLIIGSIVLSGFGYLVSKIHHRVPVNLIKIMTFGLTGMTLFGCLGLAVNPLAWAVCLTAGGLVGMFAGVIVCLFSPANDAAKVISSFLAITGTFIGVMLGAIISSIVPIFPSALISSFFGFSLMLAGVVVGNICGRSYENFSLDDEKLMHTIYLSAAPLPIMFLSYLAGGILLFKALPGNPIIVSQAIGLITGTSLYGAIVAGYKIAKDYLPFIAEQPSKSLKPLKPSLSMDSLALPSEQKEELLKKAIRDNPGMVQKLWNIIWAPQGMRAQNGLVGSEKSSNPSVSLLPGSPMPDLPLVGVEAQITSPRGFLGQSHTVSLLSNYPEIDADELVTSGSRKSPSR